MWSRKGGKDKSGDPGVPDSSNGGSPFDEPTEALPIPGNSADQPDVAGKPGADGPDEGELGFTPYRRPQPHADQATGEASGTGPGDVEQTTDDADPATAAIPSGTSADTTRISTPGGIRDEDTAAIKRVDPEAETTGMPLDRDDFHREYGRRERSLEDRPYSDPQPFDPTSASWAADTAAIDTEWEPDERDAVVDTGRGRLGDELDAARKASRRGTLDLGLLVLRVAVGGIGVVHGTQKLFGWWNGPHLSGFRDFLINQQNTNIGFNHDAARPLAIIGALSESVGGLLLILGLATPIAGSALLGTWIIAAAYKATLSGGVWFFASDPVRDGRPQYGGIEYELLLCAAAAAVILTGPGRISLDFGRGWARRPWIGSVAWLVVAVAAAAVVWLLFNGTNPFHSPGNPTG